MKNFIWLGLLGLLADPLAATEIPGPLVNGEWLVENHESVLVFDVRKETATFAEGHIPGAVLVDVKKIRIDREIDGRITTRMRPDAGSFEAFMRAHGVDNNSIVVLTHRGETPGQLSGAARLYWQMKYFGFDRVALLDGGNPGWVAALEDLVSEIEPVEAGDYRAGPEREEILATMAQVREALGRDGVTLIDTRDLRYHVGLEIKDYVYARGHIPASSSTPYQFLKPLKGGVPYYSKDALWRLLDALRIDSDNSLIVYCNSAYEASSNWFVLHELLGIEDVRLYDGSLHQWTQYESNPMTLRLTDCTGKFGSELELKTFVLFCSDPKSGRESGPGQ